MARKFLYAVVVLIVLAFAAAFAYRFYGVQLMRQFMVPGSQVVALPPVDARAYARPDMWIARPDKPGNPALWTPTGFQPASNPQAAVFFVHPTSFLDTKTWNAPLDNQDANNRAALFLRGQASAFNSVGTIWAPRYRQATFGAFLTSKASAQQALDFAYRDVLAAFDPRTVRATRRALGLSTDASYRFERGTDVVPAHRRAAEAADEVRPAFDDHSFFESLRVEPYYLYTASRVPRAGAPTRGYGCSPE